MDTKALSVTDRNRNRTGVGCAVVFCVILIIVGAVGCYFGVVQPLSNMAASESWNQVPCTILSSEVKRNRDRDGDTTYRVAITYRYSVDGFPYISDRYDFMVAVNSSGRKSKQEIVDRYPVGAEAVCFVDPHAPDFAVLNRAWAWPMLLLGLFPLAAFIGGLVWLFLIIRHKPTDTRSSNLESSAGSLNPQRTSAEEMSDANGGFVELTPASTPGRNLVGTSIFAVLWNLIVGGIIFGLFMDEDPGWFAILFMVPFVLVGIGLILGTFYYAVALFNPVPQLSLSRPNIPLGGTAELQWRFRGSTNAIHRLRITLQAVEKATYIRGTDTTTDTETFYEHGVLDASGLQLEVSQGAAEIFIPTDTMHSFQSEHNQIAWSIVVHGEIPWRPDVKSEFLIQVGPHDA